MKKLIFTSLAFITLAHFAFAQIPDCSDLFISEYLEGTGKNRVLEIYNPTFEDIDLSEYSVKVFASGPNNPNVMPLSGNLPAKEVLMCGHDQADSGILERNEGKRHKCCSKSALLGWRRSADGDEFRGGV